MSAQPHSETASYVADDPETALKYAIQHIRGDGRVWIVEGVIEQLSPTWGHEKAADKIRNQIAPAVSKLGCVSGSGNLDSPGSGDWYVPDVAVVPRRAGGGCGTGTRSNPAGRRGNLRIERGYRPDRQAAPLRGVPGARLYLLVDRQQRTCTLYSAPGNLGYTKVDGPHPFGTRLALPEPFDLELDTSEF
ncbi:hypothetical protein SANTM175S_02393 [Streptomyces antimycoticus]